MRELKSVLILMPFQSGVPIEEKASYLEKIRIKHIVEELITVKSRSYPGSNIQYKANIVNTGVGVIEDVVEKEFEKTDLFIALLTKSNVNVIFEVAILNVLQQNLILLKAPEIEQANIPVYLNDHAFINLYEGQEDDDIKRYIEKLSPDPNYKIHARDEYSKEKEAKLKSMIEELDGRLIRGLEENISNYEQGEVKPPLSFRKLVRDVHPANALSTWTTLLPISVLKARWKPVNEDTNEHDGEESLLEPPLHATTCNTQFTRLFGSSELVPEAFLEARRLFTGQKQMEKLSEFISDENYLAFEEDQGRVFKELFIQDRPSVAKIPLTFSNSGDRRHPYPEFRGKTYMPILIGKKVVGVRSSPHTTYYFIAYIEDFFPFDRNKNDK